MFVQKIKDVVELAKWLWSYVRWLVPPTFDSVEGDDIAERTMALSKANQRWVWIMWVWVIVLTLSIAGDQAMQWGAIPTVYAGNASNKRVQAFDDRLARVELRQLEGDLEDVLSLKCEVKNKRYFDKRLTDLKKQYRDLTQEDWAEPKCEELGKAPP